MVNYVAPSANPPPWVTNNPPPASSISATMALDLYEQLEKLKKKIEEHRPGGYYSQIPFTPMQKILMRMNTPIGVKAFDFIEATKLDDERMVVFVAHKGQATIIEDGADLFPSDTLITQLRMLM